MAGGSAVKKEGPVSERPLRQVGNAEKILMAEVARAYYFDGRSKVEIADDFALSRFRVAKLLDEAREHGIVSIEIRDPRSYSAPQADSLAQALGIARVKVVDVGSTDPTRTRERLGLAVMDVLRELVRPQMTIGISWSRTLDVAARYLPELPPCDLVQLAGALQLPGSGAGILPRMITQLGHNSAIRTWPIFAPLVVGEKATARDLAKQPEIAEALARAGRLDLAVVSIGGWAAGESTVWEKVAQADRDAASAAGAVAEVSGRLLDIEGRPVHSPLDDRTIAVTIEQLVRAPEVIAVARGTGQVDAVRAATRSGIVTRLVIDSVLAAALLAEE